MQTYVIAIGSPEISRQVQKALFSAGFKWESHCAPHEVKHTDRPFLSLSVDTLRQITQASGTGSQNRELLRGRRVLITSQEVIANPFQLDGAKKPVKEMTVAEIGEALGYEVKVTK
jgi:hypothetical protein